MAAQNATAAAPAALARAEDVRRILGAVDDADVIEIMALKPTVVDLEEAAIWAAGDGDVLAKSGRPLGRVAAEIVEIVAEDEDEPPE